MNSKINFVNFSEFFINMNNNNAVELEFKGEDGITDKVDIGKYVQIGFVDDAIDLKIKDSDKFIKSTLSTYSKSLLFLFGFFISLSTALLSATTGLFSTCVSALGSGSVGATKSIIDL